MNKYRNIRKAIIASLSVLFLVTFVYGSMTFYKYFLKTEIKIDRGEVLAYNATKSSDVVYLSDIPYQKAQIGWKTIGLDKTNDNASLILRLNGTSVIIKKGIWAHATSTVEYDISSYKDYAYFTTYYGLNTSAGNTGNGVKFYIYTSVDGQNWTLRTEENPTALKGVNDAVRVKIDIRDANYIRLYAYDNGSNASDHAVWGDAKLVKEDYNDNVMTTVEEFDKLIKENYKSGPITGDLSLVLLQRNFIRNVGQYQLRTFLENDAKNYEMLNWFLNNEEALRLWTIGGRPSGTYERALQVLSNLYHTYKEDLTDETAASEGTGLKRKDVYLKMMLSLSLSHSTNVGLWIGGNQLSDAVTRYGIYKQLYLNNQFISTSMFETYTVDEMRGVMFTNIDDEEIMWLHDQSLKKSAAERFNPFKYINYTLSYSYYKPQYYSQDNYAKWDAKYDLSKYNITYLSGKPKLWIVFEEGAVCGGLSKTAANLYGVWGVPAYVVGQPQHAAYIYLYNAGGGKLAWQLSYNVASNAWASTGGRPINGWGSKFSSGVIQQGSYRLLAQDAQNEYDKYERAEMILLLEDVYQNDKKKLEQIYLDALKEERINLDAWTGLIKLYTSDTSKSETDMINIAKQIIEVYGYHPLPMYDMLKLIGKKITSPEYNSKLMMMTDRALRQATKATPADTIYHKEVPIVANTILGIVDSQIATFSFTGENANKIVLSKALQSAQVTWSYSLDGGSNWKEIYEHSVLLTEEEVSHINVDNDIKIRISGLPLTDENIYTIDITKRVFPGGITINDEEDRMIGTTDQMEWSLDPNEGWNSFSNTNPIFSGNKRVYVRVVAAGTQIASDPVYYTFTENNTDDAKWYIQSKNLEVVEVNSTGAGNYKTNILDGNINTYWRSSNLPAYVTIKLDQPRYVSRLDYAPDKSARYLGGIPYGRARNINVYVSMDGTNWELATTKTNLGDNDGIKHIDLPTPKKAAYVKFECTRVYDGPYTLLTVSLIKLYENVEVNETPRAEINYNIVRKTNQDVTAELVNLTRPITVTNNGGSLTHTFTENGSFTFEFVDTEGNKGTATATVDWIDKTAPTLDVSFNTTKWTNHDVVATLSFNKEVNILSKEIQIAENPVDKSKTITFTENDSFELEFEDTLGNKGHKTISVDWIDKEPPTAEFEFNTTNLTDEKVIATLIPSEEVTVTNNDGKNTYTFDKNGEFTFEFVDKAGNVGSATVSVSWISVLPKYEITYSTTTPTTENVTATLQLETGFKIFNNNANNEYIFTENGTFEFQYMDSQGNLGYIPVTVDWIDRDVPTSDIIYSTQEWTNKDVVATLNPNEEIDVTNNDGNTSYTFTENGEFTFEFVDKAGNIGHATAIVDWIDKEAPTATIEYNIKNATEKAVTATLIPNEKVTILGNGSSTHIFTENGEFTFEFVDRAGNKGYATAVVDWIKKKEPTKPADKPSEKPEDKPSTDKPAENTGSNANKPSQKPGDNTDKPTEPVDKPTEPEEKYKSLSNGNITVKIPIEIWNKYEDISLIYQKLTTSDAQKQRYGEDSELYELSIETKENKKIEVSTETIEKRIKLDSNKKMEAIYVVRPDETVVKLNSKVENGTLIFEDTGLGKYIISYKSEHTDKKDDENISNKPEEKKKNNYLYYAIGVVIIILCSSAIVLIIKKRR